MNQNTSLQFHCEYYSYMYLEDNLKTSKVLLHTFVNKYLRRIVRICWADYKPKTIVYYKRNWKLK